MNSDSLSVPRMSSFVVCYVVACTVVYTVACLQACTEDQEAFGFEQSKKTYTLESFGEKANQFKSFYFKRHPTVSVLINPFYSDCLYCGRKGVFVEG